MKLLTIGLRGPSGYLRADSQPLEDTDADTQFQEIVKRISDEGVLILPWIVVHSKDIILARLTRLS